MFYFAVYYTDIRLIIELRKLFRSELLFTRTVRSKSFPAAGNNEPSTSAVTRVGHPGLDPCHAKDLERLLLALDPRAWRIRWTVSERNPSFLRNNLESNGGDVRKLALSLLACSGSFLRLQHVIPVRYLRPPRRRKTIRCPFHEAEIPARSLPRSIMDFVTGVIIR